MTLRTASRLRSPCELLRKINDLAQGDNDKDKKIRKLCFECEKQVKKLARELNKHDADVWVKWWQNNPHFEEEIKIRMSNEYRIEE